MNSIRYIIILLIITFFQNCSRNIYMPESAVKTKAQAYETLLYLYNEGLDNIRKGFVNTEITKEYWSWKYNTKEAPAHNFNANGKIYYKDIDYVALEEYWDLSSAIVFYLKNGNKINAPNPWGGGTGGINDESKLAVHSLNILSD